METTSSSETETLRRERPAQIMVSRPGKLTLRVTTAGAPRDLEVEEPTISIGTHPASTVVVNDSSVSRMHCELQAEDAGVLLRDCGSKNGTWIDDVRVNEIWLPIGSCFTVGNSTIALRGVGAVDVPVSTQGHFGALHGTGTRMGELFAKLERIAAVELDVLCIGETGTGKELVARGIHDLSDRHEGPFVVVDCTTLNSGIAESILFGHCRGSFTDASRDQIGLLEQADGGTLFLDEIGELPMELQPKLLRCLERRETRRMGESDYRYRKFDARVIAATNRDIPSMMSAGTFREDLYYRLAAAKITIPALRERGRGNASLLADLFLERFSKERDVPLRFDKGVYDLLERREWKGNVRELYHAVRTAALLSPSTRIGVGDLPASTLEHDAHGFSPEQATMLLRALVQIFSLTWDEARQAFGSLYAAHMLKENNANQTRAAEKAGISRTTLRKFLGLIPAD